MIREQLNALMLISMKASDKVRTNALRAIKTAFMNWETAKENVGKTMTEAVEISIVSKLVAQYEDTAKQCDDGKHDELVHEALTMAAILKSYLPKPATEEEISVAFGNIELDVEPIKKNMGVFIKRIKEMLPNADGKLVSQVVMKNLK
jgi:uncharacterized protein YqeY